MKKNIVLRTNIMICLIILAGFLLTAVLSYRVNYKASVENVEQVATLTSEGIYYQMNNTFTKPVNISLTMANDSLLRELLLREEENLENITYTETIRGYLEAYREKYGYDSVFLISSQSGRYYNFNGLDRVLEQGDPENEWYFHLLEDPDDYSMNVDNDEVSGANNEISVFVNCKIKDDGGTVIGVVGVGLRIVHLQELLKEYKVEFGADTCLIDKEGMIQVSSSHTGYEAVNYFESTGYSQKIKRKILKWKEDGRSDQFWLGDVDPQEKNNYMVTRYLPELQWYLLVERDAHSYMEQLNYQMLFTVFVIVFIVVLILAVITRVIHSFNKRIIMLTQSAEQERRTVFEKATGELFENIYELDITNNRSANKATEEYFVSLGAPVGTPFDKALKIIAEKQIKEEFRQGYIETFQPRHVLEALENKEETLHYEFMISTGGDYYWMRITARIIRLESDGSVHMLTYRQNIDAEKRQETRMLEMMQRDEMTGLLTKTATEQQIRSVLKVLPECRYAFLIFDIDDFKQANDQYGHVYGDGVICAFTGRLQEYAGGNDRILGRIGGDEFVVFMPVEDEETLADQIKALCFTLNWTYRADGYSWHISTSIGVAVGMGCKADFEDFYRKADSALYRTKENGKNGYTLYELER